MNLLLPSLLGVVVVCIIALPSVLVKMFAKFSCQIVSTHKEGGSILLGIVYIDEDCGAGSSSSVIR